MTIRSIDNLIVNLDYIFMFMINNGISYIHESFFSFLAIFNNTNIAIANANNPNKITNEIAPNASKLICIPP